MPMTRFLSNNGLWREIGNHVKAAKRVQAAVAYFGTGGADLLPLRKGDTLVVDMSLGTVRRGETNPSEIRRLIKRGVQVFTRARLHAKFLIAGNTLIASSANVSNWSRTMLDEAGVLTTDVAAVKRARAFLESICTEPVREKYLKKCLAEYSPPRFAGPGGRRRGGQRKTVAPKLWFLSGIVYGEFSQKEREKIDQLRREVAKAKRVSVEAVSWIRYLNKERFFKRLRSGECWVLRCVRDPNSGKKWVQAPARLLDVTSFVRARSKRSWLLFLENPPRAESMPLRSFRSRIRKVVPALDRDKPRTQAIVDEEQADAILRLWTHSGKISRRK